MITKKGRIRKKESRELNQIIYEIRSIDEDKVQLIVDKKYIIITKIKFLIVNSSFKIYSTCEDNFERVHGDINEGDIIGVEGFPS